MASRGKLGEWENPDTVVRSEDWQEAIRKGCEMVQIASERKVRELERRLDHLKTEAETLRRKGEELRTIHLNLESDLKDSKNQNKAQMESNKKLAQEVFAMRTDMSKLGQFRASLDQAVSYVDSRKWVKSEPQLRRAELFRNGLYGFTMGLCQALSRRNQSCFSASLVTKPKWISGQ